MNAKHYLIVLITLAFIAGFHGFASAHPDGSLGYNCSSCHPGKPNQTPPAPKPAPAPAPKPAPTPAPAPKPTPAPTPAPKPAPAPAPKPAPGGVNQPPIANAGPDMSVEAKASVTLRGFRSMDTGGGIASYHWKQVRGPRVTLRNATGPRARFIAPNVQQSAVLVFRLTVEDSSGLRDSDKVRVTVHPRAQGGDEGDYEGGDD